MMAAVKSFFSSRHSSGTSESAPTNFKTDAVASFFFFPGKRYWKFPVEFGGGMAKFYCAMAL